MVHSLSTLQRILQPLIRTHGPFHGTRQSSQRPTLGRDVTQIGSHAGSTHDIVTAQFIHFGGEFAQEREGLADATRGSEDGYLGFGWGARVDGAEGGAEGGDGFGGEAVEHHGNVGSEKWDENHTGRKSSQRRIAGCQ